MSRKKTINTKLLIAGLLVMNTLVIVNYFIPIHIDVIDFFKGMGVAFIAASLFVSPHKPEQSNPV
ncbi:MAG: hypothetical protein H6550_09170 [Chitinophagales bacterium]|nr:hypothetical protein [Chitinophagales bacterium]